MRKFLYTLFMPFISWNIKRQLTVFSVFAILVLIIVFILIYFFKPEETCFDGRLNQDEEETDCGGVCFPCASKIRNLTILWTRFFPVRQGVYDVAALVENSNQFLRARKFVYAVKLYDQSNILVAIKEHSTFILPGEKFVIFEPNISLQNRIPARAIIELREVEWEKSEAEPLKINILRKDILLEDARPRLEVKVKNQSNEIYPKLEAYALLLGENGEILGASKTFLDGLGIQAEGDVIFTWPVPISGVSGAEVYLRQILPL